MTDTLGEAAQVAALWFLGLLFITSGGETWSKRERFQIRLAYGGMWGARCSRLLALFVPPVEFSLGTILLLQLSPRPTLIVTLAVFLVFTVYRLLAFTQGKDCGCNWTAPTPAALVEHLVPTLFYCLVAGSGLAGTFLSTPVHNITMNFIGLVLLCLATVAVWRQHVWQVSYIRRPTSD